MQTAKHNRYKIRVMGFPCDDVIVEYLGWDEISRMDPPEEIIRKYKDVLNWSKMNLFSDAIADEFPDKVDWEARLSGPPVNITMLFRNKQHIPTHIYRMAMFKQKYYPADGFIDAFCEHIDWEFYATNYAVPNYLMDRYWDEGKFGRHLLANAMVPHEIMSDKCWGFDRECWELAAKCQKLSPDFMRENVRRMPLDTLCQHQTLPEDLILHLKKYESLVPLLSRQPMSEDFIAANMQWLDMGEVCLHGKMSIGFLKEHQHELDWFSLSNNPHYKQNLTAPQIIRDTFGNYVVLAQSMSVTWA